MRILRSPASLECRIAMTVSVSFIVRRPSYVNVVKCFMPIESQFNENKHRLEVDLKHQTLDRLKGKIIIWLNNCSYS